VAKLLRSAIANASRRTGSAAMSIGCLSRRVSRTRALAEEGPTAPMGRAFRVAEADRAPHVQVSERPEKRGPSRRPAKRRSDAERRGQSVESRKPQSASRSERQRRQRSNRGPEGSSVRIPARFNKTWRSRWYSIATTPSCCTRISQLRQTLKKRFAHAGVSKIETDAPRTS
jgi:hypothetical protein